MHFDWSFRLADLVSWVLGSVVIVMGFYNLNWRVKIIEDWKEAHYHNLEEQMRNIVMLREAVAKITVIADAQEKRIMFIEERARWRSQ